MELLKDSENWVDVADGLPENRQEVLILFSDQTMTTGHYIHRFTIPVDDYTAYEGWEVNWEECDEAECPYLHSGWYEYVKSEVGVGYSYHYFDENTDPSRVTHWMPLPQPPKGQQ